MVWKRPMLRPDERQHLLELLRPAAESRLDLAVGTTFSLDLLQRAHASAFVRVL